MQDYSTATGANAAFTKAPGERREVRPRQKVLLGLLYPQHNTAHEIVDRMGGKSADSSENAFVAVLPVLPRLFPHEKWAAEKSYGSSALEVVACHSGARAR